jgi:hypothetical protein
MNYSSDLNLISFIKSRNDEDAIKYIDRCNKVLEKNYLIESKKSSLYEDTKLKESVKDMKEEDMLKNVDFCKNTYLKLVCQKTMVSKILRYQLENKYKNPLYLKINNHKKAVGLIKELLKQYQWKAGGFYIDDMEWMEINSEVESDHCEVNYNEIVLLNTIDNNRTGDEEIEEFLQHIIKYADASTSNKIDFQYDIIKLNKKLSKILIWISKK